MFSNDTTLLEAINTEDIERFFNKTVIEKNLKNNSIIIFGTGLLVRPMIDYYMCFRNFNLFLCSNEKESLKKYYKDYNNDKYLGKLYIFEIDLINIKKLNLNQLDFIEFDKFKDKKIERLDTEKLLLNTKQNCVFENLFKNSNIVIPFIPEDFHYFIAKMCIQYKVNMITSNLINEKLLSLEDEFKKCKILMVTELGLQPGLDHMLCTKIMNDAKRERKEVRSVEIWCGILPSPESLDNPIMHRLLYSPKFNIQTVLSDTRQLVNGKVLRINKFKQGVPVSKYIERKNFHSSLNLEGIYTDDSLEFKNKHKLYNCDTVILGHLRYKGYFFSLECFKILKLLDETPMEYFEYWRDYINKKILHQTNKNYSDFLFSKLEEFVDKNEEVIDVENQKIKKNIELELKGHKFKIEKLRFDIGEEKFYYDLSIYVMSKLRQKFKDENKNIFSVFENIFSILLYLDLFKEKVEMTDKNSTIFDCFFKLLHKKISKNSDGNDMVFLQLIYNLRNQDNTEQTKILEIFLTSNSLKSIENESDLKSYTSSSLLVSIPTAVVGKMIIDKEINEYGIIIPNSDFVINKIIAELEKRNIFIKKRDVVFAKF